MILKIKYIYTKRIQINQVISIALFPITFIRKMELIF